MSSDFGIMAYPEAGWRQWLFKAPVSLWRLGLHPLVGRYILLMNIRGRKSGAVRHTAIEYHRLNGQKYVLSAFGKQAQWYKNIIANPLVTIQSSDGTEKVKARPVTDPEELKAVFQLFLQRNPVMVGWYLDNKGIGHSEEAVLAHADQFHFLTFDPTSESTPEGQPADLAWIWGVGLVAVALWWLAKQND